MRIKRNLLGLSAIAAAAATGMAVPACAQAPASSSSKPAAQADRAVTLQIGKPAPDFALPDQSGKVHRLADYRGKNVILAFYPKDFTGGCTCEVEALRDSLGELKQRNAVVLGISADDIATHKRFAEQYKLSYPLLADTGRDAIKAYGALGPNNLAQRYTYVIGPDGTLIGVDRAVNSQFEEKDGKLISHHGRNLALLLSDWKAKLGSPVPNFALTNIDGTPVTPLAAGKKGAVIVFMSNTCPVAQAYEERLKQLAGDFKDVSFMFINSNHNESMAEVKSYAAKRGFAMPVAKDYNNVIADRFNAQATPTVWLLDARGTAVYRGAVDDNRDEAAVTRTYLKDALAALMAGQPVPVAETLAFGCTVKRVRM